MEILIFGYVLYNTLLLGVYLGNGYKGDQKTTRVYSILMLICFGFLLFIAGLLEPIAYGVKERYMISNFLFYYRFYFTDYFQNKILEYKNFNGIEEFYLQRENFKAERYTKPYQIMRVRMLNRKFNYKYIKNNEQYKLDL